MRSKNAALFAVGLLFVSFWLNGGVRCQTSVAPPVSLAPSPSVTDQGSPPAATCHSTGLNRWCSNPTGPGVSSPRPTAEGSPPTAPEVPVNPPPVIRASPPAATDDVPPPTATAKGSARSAAAKNSPPPANDKDAPVPAVDNILPSPGIDKLLPTPRNGKLSPSQEPGPDGLIGIDDGEETGQPLPIRPSPGKKKVRQKPDIAEGPLEPLGGQAEVEKLKPNLKICQGC